MDDDAVAFVRSFYEQGKPIAAICHAPWMLVEAGIARDHTLTSFWSVKTDVRNAGGNWVDQELVVDEGIVTSRSPDDLPAFCSKIVEEIAEGARAPTDPRRGHRLVGIVLTWRLHRHVGMGGDCRLGRGGRGRGGAFWRGGVPGQSRETLAGIGWRTGFEPATTGTTTRGSTN